MVVIDDYVYYAEWLMDSLFSVPVGATRFDLCVYMKVLRPFHVNLHIPRW